MDIVLQHLTKTFGTHTVLNDISIEQKNIHALAILGPSGGGKTTLLRTIAGLEKPSNGSITMNGNIIPYDETKKIDNSTTLRNYRKTLGVVFQSFNLLPHISAFHNIVLPLIKVHRWNKLEAESKAEDLLRKFSLWEHGHKHIHQLSGGQQQRIAISRAIAPSPDFLLFDEPTSALDPDFIKEVLDTIKGLKGICDFIIVTHHTGFAKSVSDYVLFLHQGNILVHGKTEEVYTQTGSEIVKTYFDNVL